jgi:ATP-dependent DNA helicase DinG
VDVPGEALELLFIVRLPFAVPTEPIVQAQAELLEKQGINSFVHYTVPEAVIRFRQGFGRLIRTRNDRGVVVVMDNRVVRTRYGRMFLDSLPTRSQVVKDTGELIGKIIEWE